MTTKQEIRRLRRIARLLCQTEDMIRSMYPEHEAADDCRLWCSNMDACADHLEALAAEARCPDCPVAGYPGAK